MKFIAIFAILAVATSLLRAEESDAISFVSVEIVKRSDDGAGNEQDDIVITNTHKSRVIRVSVNWISVAHERETDANVKPGQRKTVARKQTNARAVKVADAQFK